MTVSFFRTTFSFFVGIRLLSSLCFLSGAIALTLPSGAIALTLPSCAIALTLPSCAFAQSRTEYFSAIDSNGNGGVSLAEFQDWMGYAFNQIDKNANDVIDADEALVPKMRGVTRAQQRANFAAQFRRQDKNKSGELSMAELTAPPQ